MALEDYTTPLTAAGQPQRGVRPRQETTPLTHDEERAFQTWASRNRISDVDHAESFYDYRGYWKATQGRPHRRGDHFLDTYKQHGHPTFSQESQYSKGAWDGGMWVGETFLPQPTLSPSHEKEP
jgi:hypothetical protein